MSLVDNALSDADDGPTSVCAQARCTMRGVPQPLHETGLCVSCCTLYGDLSCRDCDWPGKADEQNDDEDDG